MATFDLTLTSRDKQWLKKNHPSLYVHTKKGSAVEIRGDLHVSMAFSGEGRPYEINPAFNHAEGVVINDQYQIRIEFKPSRYSNLPQVYETGHRIERIVQDRSLQLVDLHINPTGATCLCITVEEKEKLPTGYTLEEFFNRLLIPFFYAQSYYEKNNKWPWGQYGHGVLGYIEWYSNQKELPRAIVESFIGSLRRAPEWRDLQVLLAPHHKVKGHHGCLCGRGDALRRCHPDVLRGVWKIKKDIENLGTEI